MDDAVVVEVLQGAQDARGVEARRRLADAPLQGDAADAAREKTRQLAARAVSS